MTVPRHEVLEPRRDEAKLRALYAHAPGTVRLGFIESADGRCAGPDGSSRSLGGPEDLRILVTLRGLADVVVVGAETARLEGYGPITLRPELVEARLAAGHSPGVALAVVTRTGDLPPEVTPESAWVITTRDSPAIARLGATWTERIIVAGRRSFKPRRALRELGKRGMHRVLIEGGPTLAAHFLERSLIDDYCLTTSPLPGGSHALPTPPVPHGLTLAHELEGRGFVARRWARTP